MILQYNIRFELYSDIQSDFFHGFFLHIVKICIYLCLSYACHIHTITTWAITKYHWKLKQELTFRRKILFIWFKQGHNFLLRFYHAIFMTRDNSLNLFQFRLSVDIQILNEQVSKKELRNFGFFSINEILRTFFMSVYALNSIHIIILQVYLHII